MKILLPLLALGLAFMTGCMHDNPATPAGIASSDLVARLTINPPTFARTSATKNLWLNPVSVDLPLIKDAHEHFHYEKASTTAGNLFIAVSADSGRGMDTYMAGSWMMMPSDTHHAHIAVSLVEAGAENGAPGPLPVLYSTVTLLVTENGNPRDSAVLYPVHGENGAAYGANLKFPLGMATYTLMAKATAPQTSLRDAVNAGRLHSAVQGSCDAMIHNVSPGGDIIGTSLVTDSIRFEFRAKTPETLWVWDAVNHRTIETPPAPDATLYVEVSLTDLKSQGPVKAVGHSQIRGRLYTADMTDSTATDDPFLAPIHGHEGFYYGANMPIPETAPITGGHGGH